MEFPLKINKYRDWSIKLKLLIISALLILCSVFLVSLLSYIQYTTDFKEQSADKVEQIIEQVSLNIDTYLDDLFRLSLSPHYNSTIMDELERDTSGSEMEQLEKSRLIEGFLNQMMIIPRKDIIRVYILSDNVYSSRRTQTGIDDKTDYKSFDWYKAALRIQEPIFIPVHVEAVDKNQNLKIFSIVRQLRSTRNTDKIIGVIKVDANYTGIKAICDRVDMGREGSLLIVDENRNVIYPGTRVNILTGVNYMQLHEKTQNSSASNFTTQINSKEYLINYFYMSRSNWTVMAVNSLEELNKKASGTRNSAFFMAVICSAFAIFILIIFVRRFLNPLMAIVRLIKEIEKGNLSVRFNKTSNDEIGYLGSSFNAMASKIDDMLEENTSLVKEVYETRLLQKEAQFNALYSQIRPHFIYNTLNMISLMIQCDRHEKAVDNINKLSSILRSMAGMDSESTVQQEIDLLDSYLAIQRDRYEGRLDYSINIDKSLYRFPIPTLLFQPPVENAVIHGCERKKEKTQIKVYSTREDGKIIFNFEDNGKGMSAETLAELQYKIENGESVESPDAVENPVKGRGIGLVNVSRRIKIKYGQEFGLKIDSRPDAGTHVKIILPAL